MVDCLMLVWGCVSPVLMTLLGLQIMIDDCIKVLHENIKDGIQYDYVINDLTEFPVDKAVKGKINN